MISQYYAGGLEQRLHELTITNTDPNGGYLNLDKVVFSNWSGTPYSEHLTTSLEATLGQPVANTIRETRHQSARPQTSSACNSSCAVINSSSLSTYVIVRRFVFHRSVLMFMAHGSSFSSSGRGAIIGGVLGGSMVLVLIALFIFLLFRWCGNKATWKHKRVDMWPISKAEESGTLQDNASHPRTDERDPRVSKKQLYDPSAAYLETTAIETTWYVASLSNAIYSRALLHTRAYLPAYQDQATTSQQTT